MFDEQFIKSLPENLLEAQSAICEYFRRIDRKRSTIKKANFVDEYISALTFAQVFAEAKSLDIGVPEWNSSATDLENIGSTIRFYTNWGNKIAPIRKQRQRKQKLEATRDHYSTILGKGIFYEFSDSDFKRVQDIINNLRNLLTTSEDFEAGHKRRLLKKLEKLQAELDKRMSDFDAFWGFFIDSGIALTRFWENAKPFRDDVKELARIVCRAQSKAEDVQKLFPLKFLAEGPPKDDEEPGE